MSTPRPHLIEGKSTVGTVFIEVAIQLLEKGVPPQNVLRNLTTALCTAATGAAPQGVVPLSGEHEAYVAAQIMAGVKEAFEYERARWLGGAK